MSADTGCTSIARAQALVLLSSKGKQIVVDDSDHEIPLFRPDVVIQAISDVSK
jgi:hypothetical protein